MCMLEGKRCCAMAQHTNHHMSPCTQLIMQVFLLISKGTLAAIGMPTVYEQWLCHVLPHYAWSDTAKRKALHPDQCSSPDTPAHL